MRLFRSPRRLACAAALALLCGDARAQPSEIPAAYLPVGGLRQPKLDALIPPSPYGDVKQLPLRPAKALLSTAARVARLRADPQHQRAFWVEQVAGDQAGRRTVFVIPQYHRSPNKPLDWTSLGAEIRQVQANIDTLMTHLVTEQGVRCVGTEGTSLRRMERNPELVQLARWLDELNGYSAAVAAELGARGHELGPIMRELTQLLRGQIAARAVMLDGVGVALARLGERAEVTRFGIEDDALNQRALAIVKRLTALEEARAQLAPQQQSDVADAVGQMWLREYPAYRDAVLTPLREEIDALDAARKQLLQRGDDDDARALGRFVSLAKLLDQRLIQSEAVADYAAYYASLSEASPEEPGAVKARPLSKKQRRQLARINRQLSELERRYSTVTLDERSQVASEKVLAHLSPAGSCAVVMGAHHQDALVKALLAQGGPGLGVVVVAPFHFEEE